MTARAFAIAVAALSCLIAPAAFARPEAFLYLANETAPTPEHLATLSRLASWLDESPLKSDRQLAAAVREDLTLFPSRVDAEVAAILRHPDRAAGLVIATNRLLQEGHVLVKGPGERDLTARPLSLARAASPLTASSPLSSLANVESLLSAVGRWFPPTDYDLVMVTHSHGDEDFALTPRVGLDPEGLSREELLDRVHGASTAFVERAGVSTEALLGLLARLSEERRLATSLLVLHSCESTIARLPRGVGLALVADHGGPLTHDAIDYDRVFTSGAPTLREAFVATLVPFPFEVASDENNARRARSRRWARVEHAAPYFLPLAAWCGVALWWRARRRTALSG